MGKENHDTDKSMQNVCIMMYKNKYVNVMYTTSIL